MPGARDRRGGGGPRPGRWIVLALAGLAILGLTFAVGVLVGRQGGRPVAAAAGPEPAKKATPARRSGLVDAEAERAREPEKLTFYQTLTAPLGPAPSFAKPGAETKGRASAPAGPTGTPSPAPAATAEAPRAAADAGAASGAAGWSVQVGAFQSRQQADALQQDLRRVGLEAYVTTLGTPDGQTRFRVRVGSFTERAEAQRAADRLRAERSLPTYVTAQ